MTVIIDSREKEIEHITGSYNQKKIPYIVQSLNFGDYSFMLPACPELGINREMYFHNDIVIERKADLEELSGNLAQHRERFENEFLRARDCDITLMVEQGSISDILNHKYRTKYGESAFMASLMAWEQRYKIRTAFVHMIHSGLYIYTKFYYYLRELLK
jgi:ERCC4-type nuclease